LKISLRSVALTVFFLTFQSLIGFAASRYEVLNKFVLGGDGGWDYLTLEPKSHRLFIARSDRVMVVDSEKGTLIAEIPKTLGIHGIALALDEDRGFTSNGRQNTVTTFDPANLKVLHETPVGTRPDAILYDDYSKRVFTFNGGSNDATALRVDDEEVAGTVALGGRPEFGVTDGQGKVYVNLEDKSELVEFDPKTLKVNNHWKLAPCEEPTGLAIDREHHRLFVGCGNKMMAVVNGDNGKVITTLPIGEGVDATRFDPETKLAFASCGRDAVLTIVHEDSPEKYSVVQNVSTERGARTMDLDPITHKIYLVTASFGAAPAPTSDNPRPRPSIVPGSFELIVVGPK
jgi:DNA-binding beta-propeller fold protein YncE